MSSKDDNAEIASLAYMASHHYRSGRLQQAKEACRRILDKHQNAEAILLLGMIAHEQRDLEAAVRHYERFLDLKPNHARTHYHLGLALNQLGQTEAAVRHLRRSISVSDENRNAHLQLGDACTKLGCWDEAAKAYGRALDLDPDDVATTIKLGNTLLATQRFADAVEVYERAVVASPGNAQFHRHLGAVLHRMGRTQRSIDGFEEALRLRPDYAKARIDYALVLRQLGRTKDARLQIQEAIRANPEEIDGHLSLALTLRQEGKADLAIDRLEQLLAAKPACGAAYHHIALIEPTARLRPRVEKLLADPELPKDDATHCHFALGNVADANGAFDRAFHHFQTANSLHRQSVRYDPEGNSELFDRLKTTYSKSFIEHRRTLGNPSTLPVFIVGLPRSGTTLVEQILASHASIHGAGELESLAGVNHSLTRRFAASKPAPECMSLIDSRSVGESSALYLAELRLRSTSAERVVDKLPGNFVRIGLIKTLFPNAFVVHCTRHPLDTCLSLYCHYFQALACSFDLRELGRYFIDYRRLMAHWDDVFPGGIFAVRYEELVAEPERIGRGLVEYLDLEWDDRCLKFHENERSVMSPSNLQVRRPLYSTSIGRWRHYEKHLGPLMEILDDS
ncbi:MAG: tetratricopeptide repeat protein [Gammaproteobacteria bacterium]|nr:tetratricopeptide repeat protein [Gammaproteobacteria bacterium]